MQRFRIWLICVFSTFAVFAAEASTISREFMLACHSDVAGLLADLLIDRDKYDMDNPEAIRALEKNHKFFTAFALVAGFASRKDSGRAYLAEVFKRGEAKYKDFDELMVNTRRDRFVKHFVARNTVCKARMRGHPKFKMIPRHLTE